MSSSATASNVISVNEFSPCDPLLPSLVETLAVGEGLPGEELSSACGFPDRKVGRCEQEWGDRLS